MAKKDSELTDVLQAEEKKYVPSKKVISAANVPDYEKTLKAAAKDTVKFWDEAAHDLEWFKPWTKTLDSSKKPFYKWFVDGKINLSYNAIDRHIGVDINGKLLPVTKGSKEDMMRKKVAILWEDETNRTRKYTYLELFKEVSKLANALRKSGVKKGDRVAIYMPNIPETAFAMLACARVGAMHSVVYAGFSAMALADRIQDAKAKLIITADGSFRRGSVVDLKTTVDDAVKKCKSIKKVVVVKNNKKKVPFNKKMDVWYDDFIKGMPMEAKCAQMDSEDPAFVLYTSGTTSKPKGIIHAVGGYQVGVLRTIKWVFDLKGDEVYWCTADPGWITGHSYIVYGPLLAGVTTLMYEGVPDMPNPDRLWTMVEKYGVNVFYTAPTLIRALMRYGTKWTKKYKMPSLRILGSVGEPINPEAWKWYHENIGKKKVPIMDTWWQTETGMHMVTPLPSATLKPGSACKPFPGIIADVVDKKGKTVPVGHGGFLVIRNQWPSMIRTIFNNPERYIKTYWSEIKGVYFAGDMAFKDKDGYFYIQGRTDDVLKIAGHRIGTAEVESAFVSDHNVAEAAVIGIPDELRGEIIKAFVILKQGVAVSDDLKQELRKHVRKNIGPIAVIKDIEFVATLPKTRSGKIMRRVLKAKELGQALGDTSSLVN